MAGIALLGTPFWWKHAASQYADVLMATLAVWAAWGWIKGSFKGALVCGVCLGLLLHTKNEGLFFAISALITGGGLTLKQGFLEESKTALFLKYRFLKPFLWGFLPLLLGWVLFKIYNPSVNDVQAQSGGGFDVLQRCLTPGRYLILIQHFIPRSIDFTNGLIGPLSWALLLAFWKSPKASVCIHPKIHALGWMILGVLLLEGAVFLVTPFDLNWHLKTALRRLLLQLWPVVIVWLSGAIPPKCAWHANGSTFSDNGLQ
jgi:hypothetical protein